MSDLNPTRPLPWKAVSYGGDDPSNRIWDVVNDHGDPQEEFSVLEYATEGEARFIVRACNAHADLLASLTQAADVVEAVAAAMLRANESDATRKCGSMLAMLWPRWRAAIAKVKGEAK